jgi:hypothetical protein
MSDDNTAGHDLGGELSDDNTYPGRMQGWLLEVLRERPGVTIAWLHQRLMSAVKLEPYWWEERGAANRPRSLRNSMTRALRGLARAGKVRRDEVGEWTVTGGDARDSSRNQTAHHEAGDAVIGMALQLPIAFACITADNSRYSGYVSSERDGGDSVGYLLTKSGRIDKSAKAKERKGLDAFGNPPRKREWSADERHRRAIEAIAGGVAEARLLDGDTSKWRDYASSGDLSIVRYQRKELGDAAKSCRILVDDRGRRRPPDESRFRKRRRD